MKIKALVSTVFISALISICYLSFSSRKESPHEKAYSHLVAGNYSLAEEAIQKGENQPLFPLSLYQGLVAQARCRFAESDYFLHSLLQDPPRQNRKEVLLETHLAQMTNAYMQKQDHLLSPLLDSAKRFSTGNSLLLFFDGLNNYLDSHYSDALRFWSVYPSGFNSAEEGDWMTHMVEQFFPITWRRLHLAHCFTEEGDIASGREILEKEQHHLDDQNSEYYHLATLFLGLTYLKEAAELPCEKRASYYKLAQFYFCRAEKIQSYPREQNRIVAHIQQEVENLFLDLSRKEQIDWGFAFVRILNDWKAFDAISSISDLAVRRMVTHEKEDENMFFCQAVRKEFASSAFHETLSSKLQDTIASHIKEGEIDQLFSLWNLAGDLSLKPKALAKEIASLTEKEMFKAVSKDDQQLRLIRNYLQFWDHLGQTTSSYQQMSVELFRQATHCWACEGEEKKGVRLMKIALQMSPEKEALLKGFESYLTKLYKQAENSNMIHRLGLLHDTLVAFGIGVEQELVDGSKLANHLADAQYLYEARNYAAAKTHAQWVLKHDHTNQKALRLVGLATFQLGQYQAAVETLNLLALKDVAVQKAIAFSVALSKEGEGTKHIVQIDKIDSFDEDGD
ncbi:MAG: hypothetical protein S4CHLAM45_12490 [Chlamydiales bacterium]|nr:hypothetical protein [Chlamydiales bacterium]MCH9619738.1 hypothetical protein [Chlamydiales bacterium]MCH9623344.1 hypothetical protein [Chlamydiales bacterium]